MLVVHVPGVRRPVCVAVSGLWYDVPRSFSLGQALAARTVGPVMAALLGWTPAFDNLNSPRDSTSPTMKDLGLKDHIVHTLCSPPDVNLWDLMNLSESTIRSRTPLRMDWPLFNPL